MIIAEYEFIDVDGCTDFSVLGDPTSGSVAKSIEEND